MIDTCCHHAKRHIYMRIYRSASSSLFNLSEMASALINNTVQVYFASAQRRRSAAAISVQQMVRNISISSWFDAFKESAVELAMETSRVTSAVRNQLEHDNPAETITTSCKS
ncbi:hypothetical protein F511_35623 [Dorcoceras hygrometricum]|uniref:Uncharacterized protein n=1 Tax=Dorcoceras hygrometricum TaxID=472368 RepID=A0A2Z7ARY5_9LAMI|nr:hypothetical protein F511_35623 [Dorcoceras hygrometricum]